MPWNPPHPRRLPTPLEIIDTERRIRDLNRQIEEMATERDDSIQLKLQLQQEVIDKRAFIAAFHRLPTEILCAIAWQSWYHESVSPSVLNQINVAMREAVNGFRGLWTALRVTKRPLKASILRTAILCGNADLLRLFLERASPSPLDIVIEVSAFTENFIDVWAPASTHFRKLEIREYGRWGPTLPYLLPQLDLKSLQELRFSENSGHYKGLLLHVLDEVNRSSDGPITVDLFTQPLTLSSALEHPVLKRAHHIWLRSDPEDQTRPLNPGPLPSLRSLTLTDVPFILSPTSLPNLHSLTIYDWENRRNLYLDDIPSQIRHLDLSWITLNQYHGSSSPQKHFYDLTTLTLYDVSVSKLTPGWISAPRLETLELLHECVADSYLDSFSDLRSLCIGDCPLGSRSLRHLTLEGMELTDCILPYLRSLNNLWTLKLVTCLVSEDILASLWTKSSNSGFLFPALRTLEMLLLLTEENHKKFEELQQNCADNRPSLELVIW